MTDYGMWWILATILVGAELVTGTFYLLAVGIAFAFGGLCAWLRAPLALAPLTGARVARRHRAVAAAGGGRPGGGRHDDRPPRAHARGRAAAAGRPRRGAKRAR